MTVETAEMSSRCRKVGIYEDDWTWTGKIS